MPSTLAFLTRSRVSVMQKKLETFLRGSAPALILVGPSGCGKLWSTERAARAVGLQVQIADRSQGKINYALWGACGLSDSGLVRNLFVLLAADQESDFSGLVKNIRQVSGKVVLIANEVSNAMRAAKFPVERVSAPTAEAMTKELFLNQDWDVTRSQRLSRLAQGDWRRLQTLDLLFQDVDVASMSDEAFGKTLERMAKDAHQDIHPTLAVHQLFSGLATKSGRAPEDLVDARVMAWGEANHGLVCATVEEMAAMQEAAGHCDIMTNAGQPQLGLEYWARSASVHGAPGLRYDYASFVNPWATAADGEDTPATAAARARFAKSEELHCAATHLRPWLQRTRQRLALAQAQTSDEKATLAPKRKAAAKRTTTKRAARGKAAPAARPGVCG